MAASAANAGWGVVRHSFATRTHCCKKIFPYFWLSDSSLYTVHHSVGMTYDFHAEKYRFSATTGDATHQFFKSIEAVPLLCEHRRKGAGSENRNVYTKRQSGAGFTAPVSGKRVAVALGALVFLRPLYSWGLENRGAKLMVVQSNVHRQGNRCHSCLTDFWFIALLNVQEKCIKGTAADWFPWIKAVFFSITTCQLKTWRHELCLYNKELKG